MRYRKFNVTGPGLERAIQEAVNLRMQLVIVPDANEAGKIHRLGYYLKPKDKFKMHSPSIIWFSEDEVRFEAIPDQPSINGQLAIDYKHPREHERHLIIDFPIGSNVQLIVRGLFRTLSNSASDFVIQIELKGNVDGETLWRPVVRYDCAHGFIHRDLIAADGKKTKEVLLTQTPIEAVEFAFDELSKRLPTWIAELGYKGFDLGLFEQPTTIIEMARVQKDIVRLLENPQGMEDVHSRLIEYR